MFDFSVNPPYKNSGLYGPYWHYPGEHFNKKPDALYGYNLLEEFINVYNQSPDQYTWKILEKGRDKRGMFIVVGARVGKRQFSLRLQKFNLRMIEIVGKYRNEIMNVQDAINYLNQNLPVQDRASHALMSGHSDMEVIRWREEMNENLKHFEKYKRTYNQTMSEPTHSPDRTFKPRTGGHWQYQDYANW